MKIAEKIKRCQLCGTLPKLEENSLQVGKTNILIIGESPAKDGWIQSGRAFYNSQGKLQASGKIIEKLLNLIDLGISDIYFTELCKCIIEDRKKLAACSANCFPFLKEQICNLDCDIILTMGLHPTQALLNQKIERFSDYVGKPTNFQLYNKTFTLIPIYHPSPANPKGFSGNAEIFKSLKNFIKKA